MTVHGSTANFLASALACIMRAPNPRDMAHGPPVYQKQGFKVTTNPQRIVRIKQTKYAQGANTQHEYCSQLGLFIPATR